MIFFALVVALSAKIHFRTGMSIVAITMPALVLILLALQLRSGIALDSWWVARHPKGTWQFRAMIAWQVVGLILMIGMAYYFLHSEVGS
jgi:hypothetical protein